MRIGTGEKEKGEENLIVNVEAGMAAARMLTARKPSNITEYVMNTWKAVGYASGASVFVSAGVLLVGACLFGFELAHWAEWQGRLVGAIGTIGGIGGAIAGLRLALSGRRRTAL